MPPLPKTGQPVMASRRLMPSMRVASGRPLGVPLACEIISDVMFGENSMERATGVCTLFFEGLGQNPEVRSQKTEDRGQRTEGERVKRLNSTENVEEAALYLRFVDFMNGMKNRQSAH